MEIISRADFAQNNKNETDKAWKDCGDDSTRACLQLKSS